MKRYLIVLLGLSLVVPIIPTVTQQAQAQVSDTLALRSDTHGKTADTLVNATTKTQTVAIKGHRDYVTIQVTVRKISGSPAGVVRLQANVKGTGYARVLRTDSLIVRNLDNVDQVYLFTLDNNRYSNYRIEYISTAGTQSTRFSAIALFRRKE